MRHAAVMLIINREGKILAVSRRYDSSKFGLPGGKLEEGESTSDAARRETLEETGVKVTACDLIYTRVEKKHNDSGEDFNTHCFYATEFDDSGLVKSSEEGTVKWMSSSELTSMEHGAFPDYNSKTIESFKLKYPEIKIS